MIYKIHAEKNEYTDNIVKGIQIWGKYPFNILSS